MASIALAAPIRPGSTSGNDITAARWARRLRELGHDVVEVPFQAGVDDPEAIMAGEPGRADVLVALHARRCGPLVVAPTRGSSQAVVVGLAGTDLHSDLPDDELAVAAVSVADSLVVLNSRAIDVLAGLDHGWGAKAITVHQSVDPPLPDRQVRRPPFTVLVLAHLREVKDPLMAARAARELPAGSEVLVLHGGVAHDNEWRRRAEREVEDNPRYRWLGELDHADALRLLAEASLLACTSLTEGGANVVTEAIALGVPVVGTDIDGNAGLLGEDYPGLVPVRDHQALAALLGRLESDEAALEDLRSRVSARRPLTTPENERREWAVVLDALGLGHAD